MGEVKYLTLSSSEWRDVEGHRESGQLRSSTAFVLALIIVVLVLALIVVVLVPA